jgi:hypothetical protein
MLLGIPEKDWKIVDLADFMNLTTRKHPLRGIICVYIIRLLDPWDYTRYYCIQRLGGKDPYGILEIGHTNDLAERIRSFIASVLGINETNTEGQMLQYYRHKNEFVRNILSPKRMIPSLLTVSYIEVPADRAAAMELTALDHYCRLFAEYPPLNCQVPGKSGKFSGHHGHDFSQSEKVTLDARLKAPVPRLLGGKWILSNPRSPMKGLACVYCVHRLQRDDPSRYCTNHRIGGDDPEGIMYIGMTEDLQRRRWEFRASVTGKGPHTSGELLHHINDISPWWQKFHGPREELVDSLLFTYIPTRTEQLLVREAEAIDDYIILYGEKPPANGQVPGRKWFFKRNRRRKLRRDAIAN